MINDYPNYKVDALIDEMLWPGHPLGRDIGGTKESVSTITRDMMFDYMTRYYVPSNIVISVAGNVVHDEVVRQVESLSQSWPSTERANWLPFTGTQSSPQLHLEYKKTEQTHLSIAFPGLPMKHPDRYALDLISVILGEGMSSRLFVEVREIKGLAYDVHSGVSHFLDTGAFVISAGVDPARLYDAVETILAQVTDVKNGISEEELEKSKRLSSGRLQLRMEDTRAVSGWNGSQELLLDHIMDLDEVVEEVNRVTLEDIHRVARDLLVTEKLNMAVIGPNRGARKMERILKV
jgi:predicted Zn-dependent peptidase